MLATSYQFLILFKVLGKLFKKKKNVCVDFLLLNIEETVSKLCQTGIVTVYRLSNFL